MDRLGFSNLIENREINEDISLRPTRQIIQNESCFVSIKNKTIEITVFGSEGNIYEVGALDFEKCKKLEIFFAKINLDVYKDFELENEFNCICRKNYPVIFI